MRATFYRQATEGTAYVRCELPARTLPGKVIGAGEFPVDFSEDEHGVKASFPDQEGAAVWQFPGYAHDAILVAALQEDRFRVFVEVDDNYLEESDLVQGQWRSWTRGLSAQAELPSIDVHRRIAGFADGVICSTEPLAVAYRRVNENVHVCQNMVDPRDWPELGQRAEGPVRVGFAGGATHMRDMPLILPALRAAQKEGCEIHLAGVFPKDLKSEAFVVPDEFDFPYVHHPWGDLVSYRATLHQFDIGLAPLITTPWSRCKSDIKALEYLMAGALPIVSDSPPYRAWRGKLPMASSGAEFQRHVRYFVEHPDEALDMVEEARDYMLDHRTVDTGIDQWREAIAE